MFRVKLKKNRRGGFPESKNVGKSISPEKRRKLEELELARRKKEQAKAARVKKTEQKKEAWASDEDKIKQYMNERVPTKQKVKMTLINKHRPSVTLSKRDKVCKKIIEGGIVALLVFSPLPAASVYEWSILVIQLIVFAMLIAYFLMKEKPQNNVSLLASLKWPKYLFVAFFVFLFVQIIPFPNFLTKIFSPKAYFFFEFFSPDSSNSAFKSFSLISTYTFREALELLTYVILGFLIVKTVTSLRQIMRLFYVMVGMGAFQAFYGLFELYNKNPRILFYEKEYYLDAVTGTFVNRNHFSGYLEMVIPLAIGIILAKTEFFNLTGFKWKDRVLRLSGKGIYVNVFIPLAIVLMGIGIIFSKSRSGVFLLFFCFLLFFVLSVLFFQREREGQQFLKNFLIVTLLIITVFALYIGIDTVIERFGMDNLLLEARPVFWKQTVDIIGDFPLFGTGLGTFAFVYPLYEEEAIPARLSHAHNDYLEYFSELGIIGFALLMGGILFLLVRSVIAWRVRHHPQVKGLALGGIIAIIIILIHSITDFNLHIPANKLLFSVVLSLTVVIVFYKNKHSGKEFAQIKDKRFEANKRTEENPVDKEIREWRAFIDRKRKIKVDFKTILSVIAVILLVALAVVIYWNQHLYYRSKTFENDEIKLEILDKANQINPLNDFVNYEMGRANFSLGVQNIEDNDSRNTSFQAARSSFERSLRINPLSSFSHFYLGQTMSYMSFLPSFGQSEDKDLQNQAYAEYKKAAMLAGPVSEIYHEVGKIYLSRWNELAEEDREFTVEFLKKAAEIADRDRLFDLMQVWAMNVQDYSVMGRILPEDLRTLKLYAQFLGEKSLSIDERHRVLSRVEYMEFSRAKAEFKAGENAYMYLRLRNASEHYESCLRILDQLNFFQDLTDSQSINLEEYNNIKKSAYLNLAKCYLSGGREFSEAAGFLRSYLELEQSVAATNELDSYLRKRGVIREKLDSSFDDLAFLSFHILLYLKQNRYGEIMRLGGLLKQSLIVVPDSDQGAYVEILNLIGDSYQREDYLYDAEEFYRKALKVEPENLRSLLSIQKNYERLGDVRQMRGLNETIANLLSPKELDLNDQLLRKGKTFTQNLILDDSDIELSVYIKEDEIVLVPLLSVILNNKVVWDGYVEGGVLSLTVESKEGQNTLIIRSVNRDVILTGLSYQ